MYPHSPTFHLVGHALEEDGGGRDFLLGGEEPVGEVTAVGQVQPHDAAVGLHQGGVHGKVTRRPAVCTGWASRIRIGNSPAIPFPHKC